MQSRSTSNLIRPSVKVTCSFKRWGSSPTRPQPVLDTPTYVKVGEQELRGKKLYQPVIMGSKANFEISTATPAKKNPLKGSRRHFKHRVDVITLDGV